MCMCVCMGFRKLNRLCDVFKGHAPDWLLGRGEDGGLGDLYQVN